MEWISVKDRLPEDYEDVLCCHGYARYMFIGYKTEHKGWSNGKENQIDVSHWMPLPEYPKED